MTKYILHGGETKVDNENNKAFYQEWVKDFDENFVPTILLVYFSREDSSWNFYEKSDRDRFATYTKNRNVNFVVANSDMEIFKEQIKKADVIYFRGGSPEKLLDTMRALKDELLNLFEGKVVIGSSAGVMLLSHATRSMSYGWRDGLGLLPINSVVHWSENFKEDLEVYKKNHIKNKYEYILLPETEFVVKNF